MDKIGMENSQILHFFNYSCLTLLKTFNIFGSIESEA